MINTQVLLKRSCEHGTEHQWNRIYSCELCRGRELIEVDRIWQAGSLSLVDVPPLYSTATWAGEEG